MTDDKGQKKTISDCGFGKAEGQRTEGSYTRHYALSTRHKKGKGRMVRIARISRRWRGCPGYGW